MSSIQNAMSAMGYVRIATFADDACRSCRHAESRSSGLRCMKGFFYVSPVGSCSRFEHEASVDGKVAIGPTDI